MNKLEQQIADLEKRIKDLETNQVSLYMPYTIRDIIRNVVIDKKAKRGAEVISDFLIFTWKDTQYKIPFYV